MVLKNIKLKNRIFIAPMAGITDLPYRLILKEMGASFMTTELVSAKGIEYKSKGNDKILATLQEERPIAVQLFGSDSFFLCKAAEEIYQNYDCIDINMGCPVLKVVRNGEGAALMKDVKNAYNIVSTLVRVLGEKIPITVKIRTGYDENHKNAVEFAKAMEDAGCSMITIHGRTKSKMYSGDCDLDTIKQVKDAVKIPVVGNGCLFTIYDVKKMLDYTGCDAVALARGVKGNPWFVRESIAYIEEGKVIDRPKKEEIMQMMKKFIDLEIDFRGEERAIVELRHHLAWFVTGFSNATLFRQKLNVANTKNDLYELMHLIE